jgi:glycyl-tRNA synthetase beta chain
VGTYKDKAERIEHLAGWIAAHAFGAAPEAATHASRAARLAKADLTTDMVREFTELQGTIGGIYARHDGEPEEVWKAMYFHYLPVGVEADAPPTRAQLGRAAVTWAAVSLADKLDTVVGLFAAGERPTGSRDPYGLRRAAQGIVKVLTDFSDLNAGDSSVDLEQMVDEAAKRHRNAGLSASDQWRRPLFEFLIEREEHLLERRGFRVDEVRAVAPYWWKRPHNALRRVQALAEARKSSEFETLATLFKRIKNITKEFDGTLDDELREKLVEPAEIALLADMRGRWPAIETAVSQGRYGEAMRELSFLSKPVDRFFTDVLVMADDPRLRKARLTLLSELRRTILNIADIAEIAPDDRSG